MDNKEKFEIVSQEYKVWNWLLSHEKELGYLKAYSAFFRFYDEIGVENEEQEFSSSLDPEYIELAWDVTNRKEFVSYTSQKGAFIRSLHDKEVALYTLIAFSEGIDKKTEGAIQALFYKKGLKAEKAKYEELLNNFRTEGTKIADEFLILNEQLSDELRKGQHAVIELQSECKILDKESKKQKQAVLDIEEIKKRLESNLKIELENKLKHANESYDESVDNLNERFIEEQEATKKRFESFREAYETQMKLKAPVKYWTENCDHHKESAKKFGIASVLLSLLIFLPIAYVAWEILASEQVVWGKVGVVAFTTSLAIWLIRVLVRMYLSHNHMQMNSRERVVMTQAYLALISEGGASSSEERNLVLQAIFRPVSTGIITDDAAPNNIIELINKARK
ncbi:DUF6161 domain-containing protein [Vibrio splendidus]|uniref:DUF6161 domain-containing protein n=2 Tax=Vibrionaceae TaxID=641 RepID=UPI000E32BA8D|nr:DUF6161 domain-containing protein [Vibrio splendidus]